MQRTALRAAADAERVCAGLRLPNLLERALERSNMFRALRQVRRNKGAPGVDGMTVDELPGYLRTHWPEIRAALLDGSYRPQPVLRKEIPKPGGGVRELRQASGRARRGGCPVEPRGSTAGITYGAPGLAFLFERRLYVFYKGSADERMYVAPLPDNAVWTLLSQPPTP
jgi:hypothetical protein